MNQVNLWLITRTTRRFGGKKRAKLKTFFFRQNESGHTLLAGPKLEGKKQDKIVIYGARKIWINIFFSRQSEAGHALLTLERHDVFAEKKQDKIVNYAWNATRQD